MSASHHEATAGGVITVDGSTAQQRPLKSGASWIWWGLLAATTMIFAICVLAAVRASNNDRGVRGPADEAAPNAPLNEKARPSSLGR